MDCLKDDFQAFGATDGSTVDNRLTFGVDRAVWTLAAKMDDGAPWHKGVLQGAEKFMTSWRKEEEEASRQRETKRDFRDREPPVCGTRSSMLAGLSCTKGVWYIYDWDTGSSILIW